MSERAKYRVIEREMKEVRKEIVKETVAKEEI